MKWSPLAHLAEITMSMSLLGLCAHSCYTSLMSLSDNLNPFQRCQGQKHKLCTYGAGMAKSR